MTEQSHQVADLAEEFRMAEVAIVTAGELAAKLEALQTLADGHVGLALDSLGRLAGAEGSREVLRIAGSAVDLSIAVAGARDEIRAYLEGIKVNLALMQRERCSPIQH